MIKDDIIVSASLLRSVDVCKKSYDYQFVQKLTNKAKTIPIARGDIGHLVLQSWDWDLEAASIIIDKEIEIVRQSYIEAGLYAPEIDDKLSKLKLNLNNTFFDYSLVYPKWDAVIKQEETMNINFGEVNGYNVVVKIKLDKIIQSKNGRLMVVDHKFSKKDKTTIDLELGSQFDLYYLGCQTLGYDVKGVIVDNIKNPYNDPEFVKNGARLKKDRFMDQTTLDRYMAKSGHSRDLIDLTYEYDQLDKVNNLERHRIVYNGSQVEAFANDLQKSIEDFIVFHEKGKIHRTWNNYVCNNCRFKDLCYHEKVGNDTSELLKTRFEKSSYYLTIEDED